MKKLLVILFMLSLSLSAWGHSPHAGDSTGLTYGDDVPVDKKSVNLEDFNMKPVHDIVSNIVYSANGGNVNDVVVNGKVLIKDKLINKFN